MTKIFLFGIWQKHKMRVSRNLPRRWNSPTSLSCLPFSSKKSHFLLFPKAIKLRESYALSGLNEYRKLLHFGKIFRQVKKNATGDIFDKASGKPAAKNIKGGNNEIFQRTIKLFIRASRKMK